LWNPLFYPDEAAINALLGTIKDQGLEVFIWRIVGAAKHMAKVRIESIRKVRKDFCIVPADGQDRQVLELMGTQSYIDIYSPDSALLCRCNIKQADAPFRYYLQLPEFVAQVERRKSLRLNLGDSSAIQMSFGKTAKLPRPMSQHFLKSCYDISTGGFSFFVSKMEVKLFQINDTINGINMKAGDFSSKVDAQIVYVKEIEPDEYNNLTYKVWRVCCRFSQIDQISKKYLEKFIFEQIKDELRAINE
jgi:c-di-GMP-binding flagellar brake protein YcgR